MPRKLRTARGGIVYHVLNRAVARGSLFDDEGDYQAFLKVLIETIARTGMRLLAFCIMPNHWHLVLWPTKDGQLSLFMRLLSVTHVRRWHAHRRTTGTGPIYQGRFKSFPVQEDRHFLIVCRYVERNPVRAGLVSDPDKWQWCSLWQRNHDPQSAKWLMPQADWPVKVPSDLRPWDRFVREPETAAERDALARCLKRGAPFGQKRWVQTTAKKLDLQSSLRPQHRPKKKQPPKKDS
jgi:putative transposase